ncbi:Cartilage matrix protein [Myotis brandtii]|uniref:Cartilage matrix protein n=1 Tax=Myotis brandtii TaxID=109478 RepID=S7PQS3_MYOBR|nr:Cartilage matrix protein [Myotis brandtii]
MLVKAQDSLAPGQATLPEASGHLCRTRPTDLVFVVDSSRSVRPVEFEKVKVFLSQVIESLNVGPNATRVGVVNYASSVKQEFPLRAHLSKAALLQAVRRIRPLSTGTMTGLAIQFAITKALSDAEGGRAKSPDISKVHVPFPRPAGVPQFAGSHWVLRALPAYTGILPAPLRGGHLQLGSRPNQEKWQS